AGGPATEQGSTWERGDRVGLTVDHDPVAHHGRRLDGRPEHGADGAVAGGHHEAGPVVANDAPGLWRIDLAGSRRGHERIERRGPPWVPSVRRELGVQQLTSGRVAAPGRRRGSTTDRAWNPWIKGATKGRESRRL